VSQYVNTGEGAKGVINQLGITDGSIGSEVLIMVMVTVLQFLHKSDTPPIKIRTFLLNSPQHKQVYNC